MSKGKTLIGGTAYTIKSGKACIGGTAYGIKRGKTLIGGTAYTISLEPELTLKALLSNAEVRYSAGRNASSTDYVSVTIPNTAPGTYYSFAAYNGYWSIYKLVKSSSNGITSTVVKRVSTNYANINISTNSVRIASKTSAVKVYGGTLVIVQFPDYTEAQIDSILSNATIARLAGRNTSTTATVSATQSNFANKIGVVFYDSYIAFDEMSSAGLVKNILMSSYYNANGAAKSLIYEATNTNYVSTNSTSSTNVYGASLGTIV